MESEKKRRTGMAQLMTAMTAVLNAVEAALTTPVGLAEVVPGAEVAWDDCCSGQVWVRVINVTPKMSATSAAVAGCAIMGWQVDFAVGILRCAHVVDDDGVFPTAQELNEDAEMMLQDCEEIRDALLTQVAQLPLTTLQRPLPGVWTPLGVNGGCVGGEWSAQCLVPYVTC